jgi:hypothetical protein
MNFSKVHRNDDDIMSEVNVRRFLWRLTRGWLAVKKDPAQLEKFWGEQAQILAEFDKEFPNDHRPAPLTVNPPPARAGPSAPAPAPAPTHPPTITPEDFPPLPRSSPPPAPPAGKGFGPHRRVLPEEEHQFIQRKSLPFSKPPAQQKPPVITYIPYPERPASSKKTTLTPAPQLPTQKPKRTLPKPKSKGTPAPPLPTSQLPVTTPAPAQKRTQAPALPSRPPPPAHEILRTMRAAPHKPAPRPPSPSRSPSPKYVNRFAPLAPSNTHPDEDAEGSDDSYHPPAPADKGKSKVVPEKEPVIHVKSQSQLQPPATQKRAEPESSGQLMKPACKRCVKRKKPCFEQSGVGYACVYCAKLKMRCEPPSDKDDEDVPAPSSKILGKRPAPDPASRSSSPAPAPTPGTSKNAPKKKSAPVPAPSQPKPKKRKIVKAPSNVESSDDEAKKLALLAPPGTLAKSAPEPAPSQPKPKKRKTVKAHVEVKNPAIDPALAPTPGTSKKHGPKEKKDEPTKKPKFVEGPSYLESSDDEDSDSSKRGQQPVETRLSQFETYCGKLIFFNISSLPLIPIFL